MGLTNMVENYIKEVLSVKDITEDAKFISSALEDVDGGEKDIDKNIIE